MKYSISVSNASAINMKRVLETDERLRSKNPLHDSEKKKGCVEEGSTMGLAKCRIWLFFVVILFDAG